MLEYNRVKNGPGVVAVLSVMICLLLVLPFLFYMEPKSATMPGNGQVSLTIAEATHNKHINYDANMRKYHIFLMMGGGIHLIWPCTDEHSSDGPWENISTRISSLGSSFQLRARLLCFGASAGMADLARGFNRFVVIPHSIHAPPRPGRDV